MFSTPSRQGSRRPPGVQPQTSRLSTPVFPRSTAPKLPQNDTSRKTNPLSPSPQPSPSRSFTNSQGADALEMDEKRDAGDVLSPDTYAHRPELSVFLHSAFPPEVYQILTSSGQDTYRGFIDHLTSFAVIISKDTTFVWKYNVKKGNLATCYLFPNPSSLSQQVSQDHPVPLANLVPHGSSLEPGLILCSSMGQVRFWNNILSGLTGAERYQTTHIPLNPSELVVTISRCEPTIYVVGTSSGRIVRLTVSSSAGRPHITASPFIATRNVISRVASSIFSSMVAPSGGESVISFDVVFNEEHGTQSLWVLLDRKIQKWKVSSSSYDELELEEHVYALLVSYISQNQFSYSTYGSELGLELLQIRSCRTGVISILVSYLEHERHVQGDAVRLSTKRLHAIALLSTVGNALSISKIKAVPYQPRDEILYLPRPTMNLVDEGALAVIQFEDAFVVISLSDSSFQTTLALRNPWDRFISSETSSPSALTSSSELPLMIGSRGIVLCQLDIAKIKHSSVDTPSNHLRSVMEQGVFFGSLPENPFLFQFDHSPGDTLDSPAKQLSHDIVASKSKFLRPSVDMRVHLRERRVRLTDLVQFISQNGALNQVLLSQESRQRLRLDAEKMMVAENLWQFHNENGLDFPSHKPRSLLVRAVNAYIMRIREGLGEDTMRLFFRFHVPNIQVIFEELRGIASELPFSRPEDGSVECILECSKIILNMYESGVRHRQTASDVYGVDSANIQVSAWTAETPQIKAAQFIFERLIRALDVLSVQSTSAATFPRQDFVTELGVQLRELASAVLQMWHDGHDYLASRANEGDSKAMAGLPSYREQFASVRPHILKALVKWGSVNAAYRLAEDYWDFRYLTELCNDPQHGDPSKITYFLQKYQERFAAHLYQWYLENGQLHKLLEPETQFTHLLEAFLRTNSSPRLEWIHDIAVARFDEAAAALIKESRTEQRLTVKHVILSVSKLSALALRTDLDGDLAVVAVEEVNHELDWISVHDRLLAEFRGLLDGVVGSTRLSADAMSEAVVSACVSTASLKAAFRMILRRLVKRLFQGYALSNEELADTLTLKEHSPESLDFTHALLIIASSADISPSRKMNAAKSIWRRVFLAYDWSIYHNTTELNDEQLDSSLRSTSLYATVQAAKSSALDPDYFFTPLQTLNTPPSAELVSRYPEFTSAQITDLETAYQGEVMNVKKLMSEQSFEEWYKKIIDLEESDRRVQIAV